MEKIFKQKNFNNFVWAPLALGSRVNRYINFCLHVHFKVSAAWDCSHYLPPVSTTQAEMVAKFAAGVAVTGGKFATFVVDTGSNFATGVIDTGGAPWLANISANGKKKFVMTLTLFSGAWGKVIHEKTCSKKSCDTVPLIVIDEINS
jgi:hypothetical protein